VADEAQCIYEYTNGNTISFKGTLSIVVTRPFETTTVRPDGNIYVDSPGKAQLIITCSNALINGTDFNTLLTVQRAAITFDATYPRLTTINLKSGVTITNTEVVMTACKGDDMGNGYWNCNLTFEEYTTA
jgi:hypothetical protein